MMKCPLLLVYFLSVWLSQGYPARVLAAIVVGLGFSPQTHIGANNNLNPCTPIYDPRARPSLPNFSIPSAIDLALK
jgi:hypothetical protein